MMNRRFWQIIGCVFMALPLLSADLQQSKELYQQGKYQEAIAELQPMVDAAPENRAARYYLALSRNFKGA